MEIRQEKELNPVLHFLAQLVMFYYKRNYFFAEKCIFLKWSSRDFAETLTTLFYNP